MRGYFMGREDIPEFQMNVDPNLKPDTVLQMGDNKITYSDLQTGFGLQKAEPLKCLIYWDDICQYTSLGLIEVINALLKANAKLNVEHFFNRSNEYDYGIKYVYKVFEKIATKQAIDEIKEEFYWKIMQISLKSELFASLLKIDSCFNKVGFYFPFRFENCEALKTELNALFFKNHGMNDNVHFYYANDKRSFNSLIKDENYNSVITPNIGATYAYIIENKLKRINIIGPDAHNGLTPELYQLFYKYRKFPRPNYCKVSEYHEKIFLNPEMT
jgi:hypothetical protein